MSDDKNPEPSADMRGYFGDLLLALSRLAGNRQSDGISSFVSREDRDTIISGCHDLMVAVRQGTSVSDEMVERAARAMCEAWHYAPIGTPDGNAEWDRKKYQYRKQARAGLQSALAATTEVRVVYDSPSPETKKAPE